MWERGVWTPGAERADAISRWVGLAVEVVLSMLGVPAGGTVRDTAPAYGASDASDAEREAALARIRAWFTDLPRGVDLIEELIQERRQQAERESAL